MPRRIYKMHGVYLFDVYVEWWVLAIAAAVLITAAGWTVWRLRHP